VIRAITRPVSPSLERCELTYSRREPIDVALAGEQHGRYEEALAALGCRVETLPEEPELPDAVFVEDIAVVLPELAVIARPGAASRRAETASVEKTLARYRDLARLEAPATLDGGDVLLLGRRLFVGLSRRTNRAAVAQLRHLLDPAGYQIVEVAVRGCLHLKSAVTVVSEATLLVNRQWIDLEPFAALRLIDVDPQEPHAANALLIQESVIFPAAYPLTARRLENAGIALVRVDVSELAKAEGGVTCCSLIVST
jgi:dimethylargininase